MSHGGLRSGAGRPKGAKNKGATLTKNTPSRLERIKERALEDGKILPLDWFMGVLNDPDATDDERTEAARYGAPYLHPRLEAVAFQGLPGEKTHEEALTELDALAFEADNPKTINHDPPSPETEIRQADTRGGMTEQPRRETPDVTGRTEDQGEAA